MESLLGQGGGEPETVRESHPDGSWRADALGGSRHARLTDHIREPLDDRDPDRAAEICATACRNLLLDFTPTLGLLPQVERLRCQALATYAQMLFDFAVQPGVEGERLAALNRLEFTLEEALQGEGAGQPAFLRMALADADRPWDRQALDRLVGLARRQVISPRPQTADEAIAESEALARALVEALWSTEPSDDVVRFGGALLRLRSLLALGEGIRRDRARLPLDELPTAGDPAREIGRDTVDRAVRAEAARVGRTLGETEAVAASVPTAYRRATAYLRLAGLELRNRVASLGWQVTSQPPMLGGATRLGLVLRARFGRH